MSRSPLRERLIDAENQKIAHAKVMIFGPTGSGKTTLAAQIIKGLVEKYKLGEKVYGYDTERRLKAVQNKIFSPAGLSLNLVESRSLQDAFEFMQMCSEDGVPGLMDNTTHVWQYCMENYLHHVNEARRKQYGDRARIQKRLYLNDWQELKPEWNRKFDTPFVSLKAHIVQVCRDKNVFSEFEEEKGNKKSRSIQQAGTAPRIEGNSAFEPYLIIETVQDYNEEFGKKSGASKYVFKAVVVKDNFGPLTGKEFVDPKFSDFLPSFDALDIGESANAYDLSGQDENFKELEDVDGSTLGNHQKRKIYLDNIKDVLIRIFPGTGEKDKAKKSTVLKALAGESGWSKWESMHLNRLEFYQTVVQELERLYSAYLDITSSVDPKDQTPENKKVVKFFEFKNNAELERNVRQLAEELQGLEEPVKNG